MTQEELGELLGINQGWVSKVESRKKIVDSVVWLRSISSRLSIPLEQLGLSDLEESDPYRLVIEIRRARDSRKYGRPDLGYAWLRGIRGQVEELIQRFPSLDTQLIAAEYFLALSWVRVELLSFGALMSAVKDAEAALALVPNRSDLAIPRSYIRSCVAGHLRMAGRFKQSARQLDVVINTPLPTEDSVSVAIQLAKTASDLRSVVRFESAMTLAYDGLEQSGNSSILVNLLAISDTHARGRLTFGDPAGARRALEQVAPSDEFLASPQWRIGHVITQAQLAGQSHSADESFSLLREATSAASTAGLIHQLERIEDALIPLPDGLSDKREIAEQVSHEISRLSKVGEGAHDY
jgi:transcriptional regulator with XRE-family HTH domain